MRSFEKSSWRGLVKKEVNRGVLFRSDDLTSLNGADLDTSAGLGIKTVYDSRHGFEREVYLSRLPPIIPALSFTFSCPLAARSREVFAKTYLLPAKASVLEPRRRSP